jgi:phage tail tape-measure protein
MARNNMTFSASLRLNTKEFKKGIADVQRSLKGLQSTFLGLAGALGLGMSFSRLGSSLMDTAVKLSTAKNTLENVSKGIGEYGESLEWLRKISNKYGQDMIVLTSSFAQFRAAASSSKLTLEEMRDVYESLTRAAGAYHMSADRTNDMMIAVTQMFSKGKVTAEELRRQLN